MHFSISTSVTQGHFCCAIRSSERSPSRFGKLKFTLLLRESWGWFQKGKLLSLSFKEWIFQVGIPAIESIHRSLSFHLFESLWLWFHLLQFESRSLSSFDLERFHLHSEECFKDTTCSCSLSINWPCLFISWVSKNSFHHPIITSRNWVLVKTCYCCWLLFGLSILLNVSPISLRSSLYFWFSVLDGSKSILFYYHSSLRQDQFRMIIFRSGMSFCPKIIVISVFRQRPTSFTSPSFLFDVLRPSLRRYSSALSLISPFFSMRPLFHCK